MGQRGGHDSRWLSDTFALAYFGDSIVAILAGQLAGAVAAKGGPTAPFVVSQVFLGLGAAIVAATWHENTAATNANAVSVNESSEKLSIGEAWRMMLIDPRILSVGVVQALFEGAMYIFVMQWPPALINVLPGRDVPFGKVFSCLMASCMIGSSAFGAVARCQPIERVTTAMLGIASCSMMTAAFCNKSLPKVLCSFLLFEACVGLYFPSIGTLRSKYLPDSHRGLMMAMFRVPLNMIVVSVMLCMDRLGLRGSLACSSAALFAAMIAQFRFAATSDANRKLRP